MDADRRARLAHLAPWMLLLAGAAAYLPSFRGVMVYDDINAIVENPHVRRLWPLTRALWAPDDTTVTGRPVVCLTLAVNYAISGLDPWSWHAVNLAIHLLAGLTLFGVIRQTQYAGRDAAAARRRPPVAEATAAAPAGRVPRPFRADRRTADSDEFASDCGKGWGSASSFTFPFAVTLLWLLHPLNTEAVTFISTRTESLMSLFLLLTLYCSIRGARSARPGRWTAAALVACALGMGSKEVMVGAPLLVLLHDRTFLAGTFSAALRRRPGLYAGLAATWLILLVLVLTASRGRSAGFGFAHLTPLDYALTQAGAVVHYLWLAVWPHPLSITYDDWPIARTISDALPQLVVILALLTLTAWAVWRRSPLGFVGAWFFLILAPSSSFVPIATELVAERRMYLPLAAVLTFGALAAVALARPLPHKRLVLATATTLAAAGLGTLTALRNWEYRSHATIWAAALAARPASPGARMEVAKSLYDAGRWNEGIALLQSAVAAGTRSATLYHTLAIGLWHQQRLPEAAEQFAAAIRLKPDNAAARADYAAVLAALDQPGAAREQLTQALEIARQRFVPPRILAESHVRLGRLDEEQGDPRAAEAHYVAALEADPTHAAAHARYGAVLAAAGRVDEAARHLAESCRLDPNQPEVLYNLGILHVAARRYADALSAYRRAIERRPDWPEPLNNLAWLLATCPEANLRDAPAAVRLAERACAGAGGENPAYLDTLAAAYASAGRFDDAIATATRAIERARLSGDHELTAEMTARLQRYTSRLPP